MDTDDLIVSMRPHPHSSKVAVVLLSGGVDSAVVATAAVSVGHEVHALTFDYGQRHSAEIEVALAVGRAVGVARHEVVEVPFLRTLGSALIKTGTRLDRGVPRPNSYVPGRNLVLLSHALAYAESVGSRVVMLGANRDDAANYPDCRPEFVEAVSRAASSGTRLGESSWIEVVAPLLGLTKAGVVAAGLRLGAPLRETLSCYQPAHNGVPCRACDACDLRAAAFGAVGLADEGLRARDGGGLPSTRAADNSQ